MRFLHDVQTIEEHIRKKNYVIIEKSSFSFLREDEEPNARYSPSEYCSPTKCDHPRAAFQQRSNAADQGGFPPYPES